MQIDLLSPKSFQGGQPHAQFRWLREHAPVYRHPEPDGPGFWAVTRHRDVFSVGRDPATYSSQPTIMIGEPPLGQGGGADADGAQMLLMMDPPRHTRFRRLVSRAFTPRAARRLEPRVRALARQIVDAVAPRGVCDFVADVAGELPSYLIAELMGLPLDDGGELYALTETLHSAREALPPGAHADAIAKMFAYASGVIRDKRARPGDDLATQLLQAEVEGRRLSDMEFNLFFMLLIDAGGDTTRNLVAGGVLALLEHPAQLRWLRDDLERRLPAAREELLRWTSPVIYMRRTATRDTQLAGTPIRAGDKVVMYYGAANRDPEVFERAETLDLARDPNHHVAFGGGGAHFCLGAHVARLEIDAMLREVLGRLRGLELDAPPTWLESSFISGPRTMRVRFLL